MYLHTNAKTNIGALKGCHDLSATEPHCHVSM